MLNKDSKYSKKKRTQRCHLSCISTDTKKANSPKIQLYIGKAKDLFLFKFLF